MLLSERSQLKRLRTVRFQLHDILEVQNYGDSKKISGGQRLGGEGAAAGKHGIREMDRENRGN